MLQIAWEEGIDTMIATPHYRHRYIENTAECLQERLEMAREAARRISPDSRFIWEMRFTTVMRARRRFSQEGHFPWQIPGMC